MEVELSNISTGTAKLTGRSQVEAELERILASPVFRTSKRSQEFLRYIVNTALEGRSDDLKERIIGAQVFQRRPDYDTGEYSIVRVKANELRKRLAQFYAESDDSTIVQILLPRGSYTPEFRWSVPIEAESEAPPVLKRSPDPRSNRIWLRVALSAGVLVILAFAGWQIVAAKTSVEVVKKFWRPVVADSAQPLICVADPQVLKLDSRYDTLALNGQLPPMVPSSELERDTSHYVGWGDALALTHLSTYLALQNKVPGIRTGNDASFAELSAAPVILIGGRSNPWTMQLANNQRFILERTATESAIRDTSKPGNKWVYKPGPPKVDYVLITRLFESKTGRMIVLMAGLSHYGTEVAGNVLTNPEYLRKALRDAPPDWETRNLQLVLRVEVFGNTAAPPTLEASNYW